MTDTAPPKRTHQMLSRPTVAFDWRDWLPYLDDDIPEDQKRQLIEALWSIILSFVDLGFEVKSPADICGESIDLKAALEATVLHLTDAQTDPEEDAA